MESKNALPKKAQMFVVRRLCRRFFLFERIVVYHGSMAAEQLQFFLQNGYVTRELLECLVHDRLRFLGETMYNEHIKRKTPPDHLDSPHLLGYFLETQDDLVRKSVRFDHGETAGEYILKSRGLLEDVISQLLSHKDSPPREDRVVKSGCGDSHCCC